MHEYLLYSQIPTSRENQVLNILAGLTGTQPVPVYEQVLVFAQTKVPEAAVSKKASKQLQAKQAPVPSYQKLIREVRLEGDIIQETEPWRFRAEQLPDPGVQAFISRAVMDQLATSDQLSRIKDASWYRYQYQYTLIGNRFVLDNIIIRIVRFYVPSGSATQDPMDAPPFIPKNLKLWDESGSWIIESIVRVEDASISTVTDQAKEELLRFQSRMDGVVDLFAPDRLALDTRVRSI